MTEVSLRRMEGSPGGSEFEDIPELPRPKKDDIGVDPVQAAAASIAAAQRPVPDIGGEWRDTAVTAPPPQTVVTTVSYTHLTLPTIYSV